MGQEIRKDSENKVKYTRGWQTSIIKLCQKPLQLKWWGSLAKLWLAWLSVPAWTKAENITTQRVHCQVNENSRKVGREGEDNL